MARSLMACGLVLAACHHGERMRDKRNPDRPAELVQDTTQPSDVGPSSAPVRSITTPPGTLEVSGIEMSADGGQAVAGIRDARSGDFGLWMLRLANGAWTPLVEPRLRFPIALGIASDGRVLVSAARPGAAAVAEVTGGKLGPEIEIGHGIPRVCIADPASKAWWIGGVFETGEHHSFAVLLREDGTVAPALPAVETSWIGLSRAEFTGLAFQGGDVVVTSPASCELRTLDRATLAERSACSLVTADSTLQLACDAPWPDRVTTDDMTSINLSADWPLRAWVAGDQRVVLIRLQQRRGWELIGFDEECVPVTRRVLPWEVWPQSVGPRYSVVRRTDLDEPGLPVHLEIWDTARLLENSAAMGPVARTSEFNEMLRLVELGGSEHAAPTPIIFVEGRGCIGDAIRDVCSARSRGLLTLREYRLAIIDPTSESRALAVASTLRAYLTFPPEILAFHGAAPAGYETVGIIHVPVADQAPR